MSVQRRYRIRALVLNSGARLEIDSGSNINRDLRLAHDGAAVVSPRTNDREGLKQLVLSPDGRWLATLRMR